MQRVRTLPSPTATGPSQVVSTSSPRTSRSSVLRMRRLASSMSSSRPVSFHQPVTTMRLDAQAAVDHVLDRVGDLEFVAGGGRDRLDAREDGRGEEVDAHEGEVAARLGGLLDEPRDPAAVELGDAVLAGALDLLQQDEGVGLAGREAAHERRDALLEEVVAEIHDERLVAQVVLGDEHGVRQAEGRGLRDVGDAQAEAGPVTDGRLDLGTGVADDDPHVLDAGGPQRLEAVEQDGLVGDRDELLRGGVGDGAQACTRAAAQDEAFHRVRPGRPR